MSYASLSDVRTYLGLGTSETQDDALLTSLIARAQDLIDNTCNRTFEASGDTTRYLDCPVPLGYGYGTGSPYSTHLAYGAEYRRLMLDFDLCAVTSVVNGDGVTIAASDYTTAPRNLTPFYAIELKWTSTVAWTYGSSGPEKAIAITGRWAYSVTAPASIQHACIRLTSWLYRQKDNQNQLDRPVASMDGVLLMPGTLPRDVMDILSNFSRL